MHANPTASNIVAALNAWYSMGLLWRYSEPTRCTGIPAVEESAWPEMAFQDTEPGGIMIMLSH